MTELRVVSSPNGELSDFLDYLYSGLEGYAYSPTKESTGRFNQHFFEWPSERNELIEHIIQSAPNTDVYLAPALFSEPSSLKSHFKVTNVLWAEFDGVLPTDLGDTPEPTLRVRSSSEGHEHWYWKVDEPITDSAAVDSANRAITYSLSADASGWDANQILRPPLTLNHKRNKPVNIAETTETVYSLLDFNSVPAAPEPQAEFTDNVIPDVADVILKYPWPQQAIDLYRNMQLPVGGRSSALMQLGYFCAEMGMSDVEIFSVIRNADDRWGKFKDRSDRNKRLTDLISRVRVKYPTIVFSDEDIIPVLGWQSVLDTEIEIEWVVPGLIQEQGYMLFTGPSGVGKTQVTLRLAMAIALGRKWLDWEIERPRKILFFSLEMGHPDLKFFMQMMSEGLSDDDRDLLERNFIVVPYGEPLYLDNDRGKSQFEAIITDVAPDGVFIDSVGSTTSGGVSNEDVVKKLMDYNDHVRKKFGVFTWWIHHMRKAQAENKKPNKMADVYGNQYLVNRATSVYCLWGKGGNIEVIPLKKRLAKLEEPWEIKRMVNLDFMKVAGSEKMFVEPKKLEYKQDEIPDNVTDDEELIDDEELTEEDNIALEKGTGMVGGM